MFFVEHGSNSLLPFFLLFKCSSKIITNFPEAISLKLQIELNGVKCDLFILPFGCCLIKIANCKVF